MTSHRMPDWSRYRHIVWDWNGTLFNDSLLCLEILNELLETHDLPPVDLQAYRDIFDFPVKDYYAAVGFDFDREPFESLGDKFIAEYETRRFECPLADGARECLQALSDGGLRHSILSAYQQHRLEEMVEHFAMGGIFQHLVGLDNPYAHGKLDLAEPCMRHVGEEPGRVLFIGDTTHDRDVAVAMKVDCVLVASGHQSRPRLEACGVPVFDSLSSLLREEPAR